MSTFDSLAARAGLLVAAVVVTAVVALLLRRRDGRATPVRDGEVLAPADLGQPLGERATLVQVSARVCGQCTTLRRVLASIAAQEPGVAHVEVLAEDRLDLVRRLDVVRTPTLLVLDGDGRVRMRAGGVPERARIEAAVVGS
ncbi:MAG: thioredoxin domain-containing protein [Kineosporiaceae bacterium]